MSLCIHAKSYVLLQINDSDDPLHEWADKELICVTQWQNAALDQHKKMFAVFQQSGVFITCCCHRSMLLGCDMIKSGELSVYVAIVTICSQSIPDIG